MSKMVEQTTLAMYSGKKSSKLIPVHAEKRLSLPQMIKKTEERPWKTGEFAMQNWGNWLHHMSAYVGKLKPGMAHWLIRVSTIPGDTVLDPFSGIGTVPLEADLMGRKGIGIDLNPYAAAISRAKFDRKSLDHRISYLENLKLDTKSIKTKEISPFIKQYFHEKTLKEIFALKQILIDEKQDFLLGCLIGILHGHRPGHLSATTSLVIPFVPKTKAEYREVIPRMIEKTKRMYRDEVPLKTKTKIYEKDSRNKVLKNDTVDAVVSSPPYYNTLNYVTDNRLRIAFLGYDEDGRSNLDDKLIQHRADYLEDMRKVGKRLRDCIKPDGHCIFVLGDMHSGKKTINTAQDISEVYKELGFKVHENIVEDKMPDNKSHPSSSKRRKNDRILFMINKK
jgi:DNA modification methylase